MFNDVPSVQGYLVKENATLREVMACIDQNAKGIALVVNDSHQLLGTITDGDIRRAILNNISIDSHVSELLAKKPSASRYQKPITVSRDVSRSECMEIMERHEIHQLPVIDEDGKVVGLVTLGELVTLDSLPLQAVIMAGGFGARLRPLTEDTPKPMLPVGDRPLMEHTIELLRHSGIRNVSITTHYQAEKITSHFGDGKEFGVNIDYVPEEKPLGTAGALGLLQDLDEPLLVINGDILTRVDFRAMLDFHQEHSADLTVGVRLYDFKVPFGVIESDGSKVLDVQEKPEVQFLVSAGIYLLEPSVRKFIPKNERSDMPNLIRRVIDDGGQVVNFPIVEYWLDIGHHRDYERAQTDLENGGLEK